MSEHDGTGQPGRPPAGEPPTQPPAGAASPWPGQPGHPGQPGQPGQPPPPGYPAGQGPTTRFDAQPPGPAYPQGPQYPAGPPPQGPPYPGAQPTTPLPGGPGGPGGQVPPGQYPTTQFPGGPQPGPQVPPGQFPQGQFPPGQQPGPGWPGQQDWASGAVPAQPRRRRGRLTIAIAASVVAVVGVAGGAYAVLGGGGGSGTSPDHYVPADAIAVADINLQPSTAQTAAALRFLGSFPSLGTKNADNLLDGVVGSALHSTPADKDFQQNIRPWLGTRIAVAADPQGGKVHPLVVAEVTDQDKARTGLTHLAQKQRGLAWVFRDDYVLISDSTGAAQTASTDSAASSLADDATYKQDISGLHDDRVITMWVDGSRLKDALKDNLPSIPGLSSASLSSVKGHGAVEVRFGPHYAELYAVTNGTGAGTALTGDVGSEISALPDDTAIAVGVAGLDKALTREMDTLEQSGLGTQLDELSEKTGLDLPGDLIDLLGAQAVLAANQDLSGFGLVTSGDPNKAEQTAKKLLAALGDPNGVAVAHKGSDHTVLAVTPDYAQQLADGGHLGDQELFKTAVPDAAHASMVVYANIKPLISTALDDVPPDAEHLRAVGMAVTGGSGHASVRLRLVVD